MKYFTILILIIGFYSCVENQKTETQQDSKPIKRSVSVVNDFELINNFESNKAKFNSDTIELNNRSTDGGELIVYHDNEFDYVVLDFWLYGETGKLNYTYWTDNDFKFKFVKKMDYKYDRPYYEKDYKTVTVIRYLSYSDSDYRLFDSNKKEITDQELLESTKSELEGFYKYVTEEIEIIK